MVWITPKLVLLNSKLWAHGGACRNGTGASGTCDNGPSAGTQCVNG